jgi:hypothetical protein
MQRAGGDQVIEQAGRLQKGDEERHLARRGDRSVRVPIDVDTPGEGVDWHWLITRQINQRLFTLGVTWEEVVSFGHAQKNASDSRGRTNSTAGFRFNDL